MVIQLLVDELQAIDSAAGIVLSLFLIFGDFEPRCSYEIVLMKKQCVINFHDSYTQNTVQDINSLSDSYKRAYVGSA